jgi:hypothetical protein
VTYRFFNLFQPVFRFDMQDMPGDADDMYWFVAGLNITFLDTVVWKFNYYVKMPHEGDDNHHDEFVTELAFAF